VLTKCVLSFCEVLLTHLIVLELFNVCFPVHSSSCVVNNALVRNSARVVERSKGVNRFLLREAQMADSEGGWGSWDFPPAMGSGKCCTFASGFHDRAPDSAATQRFSCI